jgi:hypothetical protein
MRLVARCKRTAEGYVDGYTSCNRRIKAWLAMPSG